LEEAFQDGTRLFLFSNPNNPTRAVCSREELEKIAGLCRTYGVTVIADELYSVQCTTAPGSPTFPAWKTAETMLTIIDLPRQNP
jgi:aspartate/methionine/tyrosine aminotransferase